MSSQKILQYVEIDVDYCALNYGVAPCQAQLGSSSTDNTKILLHMDGDDAATTFTDENTAGSAHTWTAHGNAQIDTADSKFGGASVFFDGTGDYIDTPDHADFALGTSDFTIDFWFKVNAAAGTFLGLCGQADATPTAAGSAFYVQRENTTGIIQTLFFSGASSIGGINSDAAYTNSVNPGWHHFAITRSGSVFRNYIDGVHQGGGFTSAASVNDSAAKFGIGSLGDFVTSPFSGWVDEFRLTVGVARWTGAGSFTPPNGPAGQTGTVKCFNTLATCQDRENFTNDPVTLRFAVPTLDLPTSIECIPSIKTIQFDPANVSLGKDLGQRATLTVSFSDHRHSDTGQGFDKYLADRTYDPYGQGTFWGKFRTRQPFVRGRPLRWITGRTDQALVDMETRHYIIDSFTGPGNDGVFKLIAKDLLKLADGDRALAPMISQGFLVSDITNVATTLTLSPTGIGVEYPESGYANIGGSEIVSFTRGGIDTYTKLLLHFDGSDASTTFTDASPAAHGSASVNGNAQVDTAQSKFGGASGLFDGTGDFLTYANHADWELGSGDFTIDWWERRSSATAGKAIMARDATTSLVPWVVGYSDGSDLLFYATSDGVNWDIASAKRFGAIELNAWHHFAVVRSGNTFFLFKDGAITTTFFSDKAFFANANALGIGRTQTTGDYAGWIDELRVSKGTARWVSPFLPPAAAYANTTDVMTIARAQLNTTASAHSTQDRVQNCLRFVSQGPDDIIFSLLRNFAAVDESYLPLSDWHTEVSSYLNRLYTATLAQPTAVKDLISELIEQAGLSMWWDDRNQEIGLLVLRGLIYNNYFFDENNIVAETLQVVEQPDKRLSQVHTYFGQINPLTSLTDKANYRSVSYQADAQSEADYGSAAIKEIFSRWIPNLGRSIADRLGSILLSRFKDPPRKISFSLLRASTSEIVLANGYQVQSWPLQDETGANETVNVQVTRLRPSADLIELETEEVLYPVTAAEDLSVRNIIVDANNYNINLRTAHDLIYPPPEAGITVILTVNSGVKLGSTNEANFALDIGTWPVGVTIIVHVAGRVQGHGGHGHSYVGGGSNGGSCIYTRVPISLSCPGQIWSGGGGGGLASYSGGGAYYWGGGGGAGFDIGIGGTSSPDAGSPGANGTTEAGGAGAGYAGAGGGPGANGGPGTVGGTAGALAGKSIDGVSFVTTGTWNGTTFTPGALTGSVLGPQIN